MKSEILLKPSYWANVSGGKDSLFMLKYILNQPTLMVQSLFLETPVLVV